MGKGLPNFTPYQPTHATKPPRVRTPPRIPFYQDPRHTIPTKWSLYRPLLRALKGEVPLRARVPAAAVAVVARYTSVFLANPVPKDPTLEAAQRAERSVIASRSTDNAGDSGSGSASTSTSTTSAPSPTSSASPRLSTPAAVHPHILDLVRARWRRAIPMQSVPQVRVFLTAETAILTAIRTSDVDALDSLQADALSFTRKVSSQLDADAAAAASELARNEERRANARGPFLTGGFMRPSLLNVPMPRLKPQPESISVMIRNRALRRERRIHKDRRADEDIEDMRREVALWRHLGLDTVEALGQWSSQGRASWETEYRRFKTEISVQFDREVARAAMQFTPEQIEAVYQARRRRHVWRVNRARARAGLGPLFDENGVKIEGADKVSVKPLNVEKWFLARARREAARRQKADRRRM